MSALDTSFKHYSPYIRLTKEPVGGGYQYYLWLVVFIPDNFTIPVAPIAPTPDPGSNTQVTVHVESGGLHPSGNWKAMSYLVTLPAPSGSGTSVNTTVYLDDPKGEGSTKMEYGEAEEE